MQQLQDLITDACMTFANDLFDLTHKSICEAVRTTLSASSAPEVAPSKEDVPLKPLDTKILWLPNNKYCLVLPDGTSSTQTRRRDVVRWARRQGYVVA